MLLFILLFRFWPVTEDGKDDRIGTFSENRIYDRDLIIASRDVAVQRDSPPVPRPVETPPEDEVMDVEYDLDPEGWVADTDLGPIEEQEEDAEWVGQPDRPPRVRRIVEPVMPSEARSDGVRMEIVVKYIVSGDGEVEQVSIVEMRKFNPETGRFEPVEETGYGFREVTLRAARQWLFHPAEHQGRTVRSETRHRFTFGN